MPLLEIVTRHMLSRPQSLQRNQASIDALQGADWVQTILVDEVGRGVPWANRQLAVYAPQVEGDYVWILDDDDMCIYPKLVTDVNRIVKQHAPDLIMLRADCGSRHGILPSDAQWGQPPRLYRISMSSFIVRRAVWQAHADAFPADLAGDYVFISAVYAATPPDKIYWHDVVVMRISRQSHGRAEDA